MGGHGGLNILPQKRWHVWREDNMKKVRDDEKKHQEEQEKIKKQQQDTEQEMRYAKMKGKSLTQKEALAKVRSLQQKRGREETAEEENFGDNIVTLRHKKRKLNPEREKEDQEKELRQKDCMRLGHSSVELMSEKPWYLMQHSSHLETALLRAPTRGPAWKKEKNLETLRVDNFRQKNKDDPFMHMKRTMGRLKKGDEFIEGETTRAAGKNSSKKKKKRKRRRSSSSRSSSPVEKKKKKRKKKKKKNTDIEELRRLRKEREKKERKKAQLLLQGGTASRKESSKKSRKKRSNRRQWKD